MKKLIKLIILVIIFQSCSTNKSLIYNISTDLESEILIELEKFDKKNVFFIMDSKGKDSLELYLIQSYNIKKDNFNFFKLKDTNRKIRIDDKLYYLVFESDRKFGTIIENQKKIQSIKEREYLYDTNQGEKVQGIDVKNAMYHNGMYFKFENFKLINKSRL